MGFYDGVKRFYRFLTMFPDPDDMFAERWKREQEIDKHTAYRTGDQEPQLKVKLGQSNDNVRSNLVGKIVDQSINMLLSGGVEFDLPGEGDTPESVWLDACWEANNKKILMTKAALNASDSGIGYLKIVPDGIIGRYEDLSGAVDLQHVFPRLINIDPRWMRIDTNPEDCEQVIRYTIEYITDGPDGKPMQRREVTEHMVPLTKDGIASDSYWLITNYRKLHSSPEWEKMGEPVAWEYDFPPIIHWQNLPVPNGIVGAPDIMDDTIELQDRRNFVASNINKIIRYHAHPKTYGINVGKPEKQEWGVDQMILFNNGGDNGEIGNLEMQSDLTSSIEFYDLLGKQMLDQTCTVDISNLRDKLGDLTNFSVRVLFQDAIWKMQLKRAIWTNMLTDLNHRLLVLGDQANTDPGVIVWPKTVLPVNDAEVIQTQKTESEMGIVSKQTIAKERGRDWEAEQERIDGEKTSEDNIGNNLLTNFLKGK